MKKIFFFLILCLWSVSSFAGSPSSLELLQDLIRIDTSNPPGNEIAAARYVQGVLAREGIVSEILESAPGRGNLIARLKSDGSKPAMILLGHLDVVPAEAKEWKFPPFVPEVRDGDLWGRGALDMKSLVAMEIAAVLKLKREKTPLAGDVILVLTADEEAGGKQGAEFLVENHWDKIEAKYVLNEGSAGLLKDGMHLYGIQVAEKGVAWMKLTAQGVSGHGSMPPLKAGDNAVTRLADVVHRLAHHRFAFQKTKIVEAFLDRVGERLPFWKKAAAKIVFLPGVGSLIQKLGGEALIPDKAVRAILSNTLSPTMLQAGYKSNVIPAEATAVVDARLLPGTTPEGFRGEIQKLAGDGVTVELMTASDPNESDFDTEYFRIFEDAVRARDPEAVTAPILSAGATDSRFFRRKGAIAYGLIPLLLIPEQLEGLHGKNERIPVEGIEAGAAIVYDVVMKMQGKN